VSDTPATVEQVLAGRASYDDLATDEEQALVRAEWDRRMVARISDLDFEAEFLAAGEPWAEADTDGNLVIRTPLDERDELIAQIRTEDREVLDRLAE
jgi:hypothetical protein